MDSGARPAHIRTAAQIATMPSRKTTRATATRATFCAERGVRGFTTGLATTVAAVVVRSSSRAGTSPNHAARRAAPNVCPSGKRPSGAVVSARRRTSRNGAASSGMLSMACGDTPSTTSRISVNVVVAEYGMWPVSSSNSTTATAYRSARPSGSVVVSCSGAM